jgi:hypothetical protein
MEIGLLKTKVLTSQNLLKDIPNSNFSSTVFVLFVVNSHMLFVGNLSCSLYLCYLQELSHMLDYHAELQKISINIKHFDKINKISNEVQKMLRLHELVVLQKELPSCSLSGVLTPRLELSISYNMKNMVSNII